MRRSRQLTTRNRIDLDDAGQIRSVRRRLGISDDELRRLVGRVGNSISAVAKEVELARALPVKPAPAPIEAVQPDPLAVPA